MSNLVSLLKKDRLETELPDKKPLYTEGEARAEAERCLYCADAPCIKACPTEIDIPTFIKKIASGNVMGAAQTIFAQNMLGYSCARVCPVEVLCAGDCVYNAWGRDPIQIGRLQRYATEAALEPGSAQLFPPKPKNGRKVAAIGAGPASLAFCGHLALEGFTATMFERFQVPGGLNTWGIAPYKLLASDSLKEIEWVGKLGVDYRMGVEVGKNVTGAELLAEYEAVFIGVGLGEDSRLGVPGEDGPGVVGAVEWIRQMKLDKTRGEKLGRVIVVGGGNTAIDVARECALLGADDVAMVYRRAKADMSGYEHEMSAGRKEGVRLVENAVPVAVIRDGAGKVTALRVAKGQGGKPIAGTEHDLPCDLIALAIGQAKLRDIAKQFPGVEVDAKGCVVADPKTGQTGNPKVFAGGDCVNGGKEVVNAVADGRNAARFILAKKG